MFKILSLSVAKQFLEVFPCSVTLLPFEDGLLDTKHSARLDKAAYTATLIQSLTRRVRVTTTCTSPSPRI